MVCSEKQGKYNKDVELLKGAMMSAWAWIVHNKEWLFSGAGLLVITGVWKILGSKATSVSGSVKYFV
jgi:hypothetical protein